MGKKKSCNGGGGGGEKGGGEAVAREFVLKVAMHCRCHGCTDKLRAAVRDLALAPGVEVADSFAAESSGEVHLLTTADPDRLRRRVRKATGKKVDLLLPPRKERSGGKKGADDAALQALLADLQLHAQAQGQAPARQQYGGHGAGPAWAQQQQQQLMGLGLGGGGGWNGSGGGYGAAYPWPSASSYYPAAPTDAWGPYGYAPQAPAPVHGNAGYYGAGGAPAWLGY